MDEQGRIVDGFSDALRQPSAADICINEEGGYQFRLFPGGEENPVLYAVPYMIPLYKYENGSVAARAVEEIEADTAALPEPAPSWNDQMEAQLTYTAMMTDTLLEEV